MVRSAIAASAIFAMVPASQAQNDPLWKRMMAQALTAAARKDYPASEQAFQRAVKEAEYFGPKDVRVGTSLNALGLVYRAENKFGEAEATYRRALAIMESAYGDSIDVANVNFNIAGVMFDQGHQADALPFVKKALDLYTRFFGDSSMKAAATLCMEGDVYRVTKRLSEAEVPLRRCADIREKNAGVTSNDLADALHSLALVYMAEGKFSIAESRLTLVEKIREKNLGITSPILAQTMEDHAAALKGMGREKDAEKLTAMAASIRKGRNKDK